MCFDDSISCCEISLSGIDTTPSDDPDKIWKCDSCGKLYKIQDKPYKLIPYEVSE